MRKRLLAGDDGAVNFVGSDDSPFIDRVRAEAAVGKGTDSLVAGQHGDLAGLAAEGLLRDLDDLADDLADRDVNPDFLELARLGGGPPLYIPWALSTYLMATRKVAVDMLQEGGVDMLQDGVDIGFLSYDELLSWAPVPSQFTRISRQTDASLHKQGGPSGLPRRCRCGRGWRRS